MCRPSYFTVNYSISPWMKSFNVNQSLAFTQWHTLVRTYRNFNIKVSIIEQEKNLSDMVFTTDCGIVHKNIFIPANFTFPQRQLETYPYISWFSQNNFKIKFLSKFYKFEGGDFLYWNKFLLAGTGFRSNIESVFEIGKILKFNTLFLELINKNYYHLDTCLLPLDSETVFYYPSAFSQKSQILLKKIVPNLIPISQKDSETFVTNSMIYQNNIICQKGLKNIKNEFINLGYNIIEIDLGEFKKAGGGIHCLTKIIN